ncbi:dihydrolipoyl dehydrogenase [Candidatus Aerophobetes bacterium]|uniref:Dihydrolipoyl dehydrogenase n=1 Tax=Aerophobetes bacterium TaxID=2030807 RepID=A0A2A4WZ23_UNCAE|nr:MAG: dihydrolipoyl dehydrogenase [Candidatus Aerophobetes bacterium]
MTQDLKEYDLIVVGSGPGGYVGAIRAAQLGLKTLCIEAQNLGGTCLNVGCIPSKCLLHSSELFYNIKHHAKEHGIEVDNPRYDFAKMMERKEGVIQTFRAGIEALLKKNKIDLMLGKPATFKDAHTLDVGGVIVKGRHIMLATGSSVASLPFLSIDEEKIISSAKALSLDHVPASMVVIGAGYIGVELGSVYARLGTKVQFVEFFDRVCPGIDPALSIELKKALEKQGMEFKLSTKVTDVTVDKKGCTVTVESSTGGQEKLSSDIVLVSVGRKPNIEGLGLDSIGVTLSSEGGVMINDQFKTNLDHIYAIGDIVDGPMLAHKAEEEGAAVAEIIAGEKPVIDYTVIPSVIYTSPEVACCGLSEQDAKDLGLSIKTAKFPFKANSRAKAVGSDEGFVKLIVESASLVIIGAHMIGPQVGELIGELALAIQEKVTAPRLSSLCHAHPTLSEALKEAALQIEKRAIHM